MKCRKQLVLTGHLVQYIDLREQKPRTHREQIHVADKAWLDALALTGQTEAGNIKQQYERVGYKVLAVEPIKPKRMVELDLCQLWNNAEPPISEKSPATNMTEEDTAE